LSRHPKIKGGGKLEISVFFTEGLAFNTGRPPPAVGRASAMPRHTTLIHPPPTAVLDLSLNSPTFPNFGDKHR
jgi:hypothetical protein